MYSISRGKFCSNIILKYLKSVVIPVLIYVLSVPMPTTALIHPIRVIVLLERNMLCCVKMSDGSCGSIRSDFAGGTTRRITIIKGM